MKNEIIEKIKKLLALANSDNQAEAELAAQRAQAMLVKYNLTMSEVDKKAEEYERVEFDQNRKRQSKDTFFIQRLLVKFFFVDIVIRHERGFGQRTSFKITTMLGKSHNIAIAKDVSDFLHSAFKNLWVEYKKQTGCDLKSKDSFYLGLYNGLSEQLEANKVKVEQEVGLVVVPDAGLIEFKKQQFPRLKFKNLNMNRLDSSAKDAGHAQGKALKISRSLNGTATNTTLRLTGK